MGSSSRMSFISTSSVDLWSKVFRATMIGNPPPRLWETAAGMLNAIGLQNIGARRSLPRSYQNSADQEHRGLRQRVGYTREDYERTIEILNDGEGIAAYELNVSCPNTTRRIAVRHRPPLP